jgi:NAD(P)-dependent dehydrogenase (short-subunit alcohol dehydrogenase family)
LLQATARTAPKDSVRVVWSGSAQIEMNAPRGGVDFARFEKPTTVMYEEYGASKAGNWFFAVEGAERWGRDGIISVCQNPGNLYTGIYANEHWLLVAFFRAFFLYEAKYGAYTLLFAGFSPKVNEGTNGAYIWPWGNIKPPARADVVQAASEGKAKEFWDWCERAWKQHV